MKTKFYITFFFIQALLITTCVPIITYSQTAQDSIIVKKNIFGGLANPYSYIQNNHRLYKYNLGFILKSDEEAYKELKSAQNIHLFANLIDLGVLLLMLYGVTREKINFPVCFVGLGMEIASIPLLNLSKKKTKRSVEIFNSGLRKTGYYYPDIEVKTVLTNSGIVVKIYF